MTSRVAVALISFVALFAAPQHVRAGDPPLSPTILTNFDPLIDGQGFPNTGTIVENRGTCFGMSLISIDNYMRRVASGEGVTPNRVTTGPEQGYLIEQVTASSAQANLPQRTIIDAMNTIGYADPIADALRRIEATGEPEVLGFFSPVGGHAVVLTGWNDGNLLIYDPNYPGEIYEWPFDPSVGLGEHPKADGSGGLYDGISQVSSLPPSTLDPNRELQKIRAQCESGAAACFVGMLPVQDVVHAVDAQGDLVITGRVDDYAPNRRVWVVVDNNPVGVMAPVDPVDGSFKVTVPAGLFQEGSHVQLALTSNGQLAGFTDVMGAPTEQQGLPTQTTEQQKVKSSGTPPGSGQVATPGFVGALEEAFKPVRGRR